MAPFIFVSLTPPAMTRMLGRLLEGHPLFRCLLVTKQYHILSIDRELRPGKRSPRNARRLNV